MKNKDKVILIISIFIFIFIGMFSILIYHKYDSIKMLSLKREYNLLVSDKLDSISIPLYFGKNNTFLTKKERIEKVNLKNNDYEITVLLDSIKPLDSIKFKNNKYYGYSFSISFNSSIETKDPVFLEDTCLTIFYDNNENVTFEIGNISILFRTPSQLENSDLSITKLSAVTNVVNNTNTIVGINLTLYNRIDESLKIKKIMIKNPFYELDYVNREFTTVGTKVNLKERDESFEYLVNSLDQSMLDDLLENKKYYTVFIPLKYLNGIRHIDTLPLYISYTKGDQDFEFIMPQFVFMSSSPFTQSTVVKEYVYKYK